jgi:hypothetical protein
MEPEGFLSQSGFARFARVLVDEANAVGRPVLLTFGDSHRFEMRRPFPGTAPGIMVLETFEARHVHALCLQVAPEAGCPFAVQPLINPSRPHAPHRRSAR